MIPLLSSFLIEGHTLTSSPIYKLTTRIHCSVLIRMQADPGIQTPLSVFKKTKQKEEEEKRWFQPLWLCITPVRQPTKHIDIKQYMQSLSGIAAHKLMNSDECKVLVTRVPHSAAYARQRMRNE